MFELVAHERFLHYQPLFIVDIINHYLLWTLIINSNLSIVALYPRKHRRGYRVAVPESDTAQRGVR